MGGFHSVLRLAIKDFLRHGYDSPQRLALWVDRLRQTAEGPAQQKSDQAASRVFDRAYYNLVDRGLLLRAHRGLTGWRLAQVRGQLTEQRERSKDALLGVTAGRRDLQLEQSIQRFIGWATALPPGGVRGRTMSDVREDIAEPVLKLARREALIKQDQKHKMVAGLHRVVATEAQALAAIWHSMFRKPGYQFRPDHKERDSKVYVFRGNWALRDGLMTRGDGYIDDITWFGEEPHCSCTGTFFYDLKELPDWLLTNKGRKILLQGEEAA